MLLSFQMALGQGQDYGIYHHKNRQISQHLLNEDWAGALAGYQELLEEYEFVFNRDLRIALQMAMAVEDKAAFYDFSSRAFEQGWRWKKAKKQLKNYPGFKTGWKAELKAISKATEPLPPRYPEERKEIKKLFAQDQKQALGAWFTFSSQRHDRYAERKFAPKALLRVQTVTRIMDETGYPGEQLIQNNYWTAVILSHYNSISVDFVQKDSLYAAMKSRLWEEWNKGHLSPSEFAMMDNWYEAIRSDRTVSSYAIVEGEVSRRELDQVNKNRLKIGLLTVEEYNQLIALQKERGFNFFLDLFSRRPIEVKND